MTKNRNSIDVENEWVVTAMVWLMRIVVGGVFVLSGLAKAIDPWGSFYKFNEYLLALGWGGFTGLSLCGAFALPIIETILGVMILVGVYRRVAPILTLVFMLFMLPLTLWLAVTNAVPDCGCFGDALILSNWGTFGKNVALAFGLIFLLIFNTKVKGLYGPAVQWIIAALTFAFALALGLYGYFTQPLVDFRPYPVGTRLTTAVSSGMADDEYMFIYSKDGEEVEFTIDSLPEESDGWEFVDRRPIKHKPDTASIILQQRTHQLAVIDGGLDVSDDVLASGQQQLLLLFPDIQDVNIAHTFVINELTEYARAQGASVYGITSASESQIDQWNDISMADYPMLNADDSDIKMMARGNPAVVYVNDGFVKWKRTLGSINAERLRDPKVTLATLSSDYNAGDILRRLVSAYLLLMAALLIFNRTHVLMKFLYERLFKKNKQSEDD
ncbi:MAG: DoxX family protein [Muribaculaceae bacterium]|nr:DoxX family protein [Muribaculaceae bacterium]